jgi:hypothetical protein
LIALPDEIVGDLRFLLKIKLAAASTRGSSLRSFGRGGGGRVGVR